MWPCERSDFDETSATSFDSPGSVQNETDYINNVFSKNNYNTDFVRRNTHSNANSPTLRLTLSLALLRQ